MAKVDKVSTEKHEGDVTCLAYHNNQVFSGGADGKIKIWDNDLNLIKSVDAHEAYMYAMAINTRNGKLYSSSCDGCVKFMAPPYDQTEQLFSCEDAIQAMYCDGDTLYTGDEKGVVTNWIDDKIKFKYNLVEEVKSLAAEKSLIYTVRDLDVVVSEMSAGKSGKYSNKAVLPGKSPMTLVGPVVDDKRTFLAFADRTGKGLSFVKNLPQQKFETVWNLPDCHELIVQAICGDDKFLYSGGYDNKVKGWTNFDQAKPTPLGEVEVGSCVNAIVCGANNWVYIGTLDGIVRRARFV
ncbi:E3 ubiquitin-protein ligase TRAF7 [Anastrepha ludens]|uniref:E3 ubiquitin-protein ligase TRAF7 n=1 Tax=Anastrepha ludens TaxID=28586 RepID=UPI0023AE9960|nr:E3 ubiquitin-protein ligase TRAF7 [Anastrepha ludens]